MRPVRACAAIAARISASLLLAACATEPTVVPPAPTAPVPVPLPAPLPTPIAEPRTPDGVRSAMMRWFRAAKYEDYQIEALLQHAKIESGFRPCVSGPGGLRYTYQWGGLRLQRLRDYAGSTGCPTLEQQLAFADRELRNEPNFACFWNAKTEPAALTALRRGFGRGSC